MTQTSACIFVVWIDREHAKLFQLSREKMERTSLKARHTEHHTHAGDHFDIQQRENRFYDEVADRLSQASQLLILGPGIAKHHFRTYLNEHRPSLGRSVVGCETVDHPSDGEIAALARRFFKMGEAS